MKRIAALGLVLVILGVACSTRGGSGAVAGTATMDGSPLPGATVTLTAPDGTKRSAITDVQGHYRFAHVAPGWYTVRFELAGLTPVTNRVKVAGSRQYAVSARLRPAGLSEAITVTAASVMIDGLAIEEKSRHPKIAEHGFIDVAKQPTTTFAIDVDRASYANVRRHLAEGEIPPPEAVRIEEMINYFSYDYPQPADEHPFSITVDAAGCPWNAAHRIARIGIQGRVLEEWKMAANNLVFLIDVSGSMDTPDGLPLIRSSFHHLVDRLRPQDSVAIVVYAGAAGVVLPPTSGADKQRILEALDGLEAGGSTAGAEGIELAYNVAQEKFRKGANNRVILATDGDFNVGPSSLDELQDLIEAKRDRGIFLSVVGVGWHSNDAMMEMLADKGDGHYVYFDTPREAEKVFKQELTGTLVTIAKDVKVQVEFDPRYVASYRQIGYENRALDNEDFEDDSKDAGDLGAGHSVTALYEIVPAPGAPATGTIASVKLRYKAPYGFRSQLLTASIVDDGKSAYAAPPDLQFAMAVAQFGMLLRDSPHKGTSTYEDALALARASRGADLEGVRGELIQLLDTSRAISAAETPAVARRD